MGYKKTGNKSKSPKGPSTWRGKKQPSTKQNAMQMNRTIGNALYGYLEDKPLVPVKEQYQLAATDGVTMKVNEYGRKSSIKSKSPSKKRGFSFTRV